MISAIDIEAFAQSEDESIGQALEYARRAEKGLPVDRLGSARQMILAAKGIKAMATIIGMQTAVIEGMSDDT